MELLFTILDQSLPETMLPFMLQLELPLDTITSSVARHRSPNLLQVVPGTLVVLSPEWTHLGVHRLQGQLFKA